MIPFIYTRSLGDLLILPYCFDSICAVFFQGKNSTILARYFHTKRPSALQFWQDISIPNDLQLSCRQFENIFLPFLAKDRFPSRVPLLPKQNDQNVSTFTGIIIVPTPINPLLFSGNLRNIYPQHLHEVYIISPKMGGI